MKSPYGMIRYAICLFVFKLIYLLGCSTDELEKQEESYHTDHFELKISVKDASGEPISPSILYVYRANERTDGKPHAIFTANESGLIDALFSKYEPSILKLEAAWHRPVEIFLPSDVRNGLSIEVIPATILKSNPIRPALIGDFNHFDPFDKVEMALNNSGHWVAEIQTDSPEIRYMISGFNDAGPVHGTHGSKIADPAQPGLVTILKVNDDGIGRVTFDPDRFPQNDLRAQIRFPDDTPSRQQGIAKLYTAMQEQADLLNHLNAIEENEPELFEQYLAHIEHLNETYDHQHVEQAYRLAKARFADHLNLGPQFIDNLMQDLDSNSELWLFAPRFVHDLFTYSSRMETVSKNIWDIYRQQPFEEVQSEALYSLINFHYDRGEDEEWYEAHFELVRSFPQSIRINYSYQQGFAPESVVHIGQYFPDIEFSPIDPESGLLIPAETNHTLTILYFWSIHDSNVEVQFDRLEYLSEQFAEKGLEIIPIALDDDRNRVKRFHQHRGHTWKTGIETFTSPQIQVLGITNTPHTLFIDENNRVLYHGSSILDEEELPSFVEALFTH